MVLTAFLTRRWRPDQQVRTTAWGLVLLGAPILVLALASFLHMQTLLRPVLLAFGAGFGIFTVGGVSLLMAMNKESQAGSYLALWSVIQLVTRGAGIAMGGVIRDVALAFTGSFDAAYGVLFTLEALGLFVAIWLLLRVDVAGFAREHALPLTSIQAVALAAD